ncbi:zinc ribbon domain-containing protein [Ornithinibacillus scapharcae]|uniref:zinc ribbon domain-containing protein n=1 Tax=Ornithinibacillus scapharcae TaxID=1147159 RepID=UPI000225B9FB|nr:zinc ribbon domain-containing protein [Ornithinibacillus scapharcae]
MKCSNCQHEQQSGKYCEKCGSALTAGNEVVVEQPETAEAETAATTTIDTSTSTSNETSEKVKKAMNNYGTYFLNHVKNPTNALKADGNLFTIGLINSGIYILTFGLAIYLIIHSITKDFTGIFRVEVPFFSILFRSAFIALLFLAIGILSTIAMAKWLGKSTVSYQQFVSQYGSLLVPILVLHIVAILGALFAAPRLTLGALALSLILVTVIVPALLTFEKVQSIRQQSIYLSFGASLLAIIISYIVVRSLILDLVERFGFFF